MSVSNDTVITKHGSIPKNTTHHNSVSVWEDTKPNVSYHAGTVRNQDHAYAIERPTLSPLYRMRGHLDLWYKFDMAVDRNH